MVEYITVTEGPYAGRQAKIFASEAEVASAYAENTIVDNEIGGFRKSTQSLWTNEGRDYAVGIARTSTGAIQAVSLHSLPDPGWYIDNTNETIYGPDGTVYPLDPGTITLLVAIIVFAAIATVFIMTYFIVARLTRHRVAVSEQINSSEALITYPDESSDRINKDTGEVLSHSDSPSQLWLLLAIAGVTVVALFVLPGVLKSGGHETAHYEEYEPPPEPQRSQSKKEKADRPEYHTSWSL